MAYRQSIENCFEDAIGAHGAPRGAFHEALEETRAAIARIKTAHDDGAMTLFQLPAMRGDLAEIADHAETLGRGASDIVILGTGGSSLGGQAITQLTGWRTAGTVIAGRPGAPRIHFMDNLDPESLGAGLYRLDLKPVRFIVISKSGNTPETVMQMLVAIEALKQEGLEWNIANHFLCVSEPGDENRNTLRHLCALHAIPVIDHAADLGGRYAVLSVVGVLPAVLSGLDPVALRLGAADVLNALLAADSPGDAAPAVGAALNATLQRERGVTMAAIMPYADRLGYFSKWFVQLWAESLAKGGKGMTPLAASGPVDQHSQLQLYLDGPADKLVTLIAPAVAHIGPAVPASLAKDPLFGYLAGHTVGDLVDCEQRATAQALAEAGRPVRVISIDEINERTLGALFMHFMLETIIMGDLTGVDVFSQPAVEAGKTLARDFLKTM